MKLFSILLFLFSISAYASLDNVVGTWRAEKEDIRDQFGREFDPTGIFSQGYRSYHDITLKLNKEKTFTLMEEMKLISDTRGTIYDASIFTGTYEILNDNLVFKVISQNVTHSATSVIGESKTITPPGTVTFDYAEQYNGDTLIVSWDFRKITFFDKSKAPPPPPQPPIPASPEKVCCGELYCNQQIYGVGGGHFTMNTCGTQSQALAICSAAGSYVISANFTDKSSCSYPVP